MPLRLLPLLALLVLAACQTTPTVDLTGGLSREDFAGKTIMTYSAEHGTQIAYAAPDGAYALWYPGNARVLQGGWKLQDGEAVPEVCFRYEGRTFNPVTGVRSRGEWQCRPLLLYNQGVSRRTRDGDIFGLLGARTVPFILERRRTNFDTLLDGADGRCGISQC